MAPTRTKDSNQNAEASSSKARSKAKRQYQRNAHEQESNSAPGVQKIKAALRQTRRLLAKVVDITETHYFFHSAIVFVYLGQTWS